MEKTIKAHSAIEVAHSIIAGFDDSVGEIISNLKLQKMLYYLQGFFIAAFDKKLFEEPIIAWQYGPVVRKAYEHFNGFGKGAIILNGNEKKAILKTKELSMFSSVMEKYGQFSAIKLMQMTHEEPPWKETFKEVCPGREITYAKLKKYFLTRLE
jgi:uncharacterized phage-associated protein